MRERERKLQLSSNQQLLWITDATNLCTPPPKHTHTCVHTSLSHCFSNTYLKIGNRASQTQPYKFAKEIKPKLTYLKIMSERVRE